MNGTEQRAHRTVTSELATSLEDVQRDLAAVIDQAGWAVARAKDLGRQLDGVACDLGDVAQQVAVLKQQHRMLEDAYIGHEHAWLTLWGRLRWLVRGR